MQKNKLDSLKDQVLGNTQEYDLLDVYHVFMKTYGYIPFDDFKHIDASLVDELSTRINKDNEAERKANK